MLPERNYAFPVRASRRAPPGIPSSQIRAGILAAMDWLACRTCATFVQIGDRVGLARHLTVELCRLENITSGLATDHEKNLLILHDLFWTRYSPN